MSPIKPLRPKREQSELSRLLFGDFAGGSNRVKIELSFTDGLYFGCGFFVAGFLFTVAMSVLWFMLIASL